MKQMTEVKTTLHLSENEYKAIKDIAEINCIGVDCSKCIFYLKNNNCISKTLYERLSKQEVRYTIDD